MPIKFNCGECDRAINVKDELAGKRIKCPGCAESVTVPDESPPRNSRAMSRSRPSTDEEEDERPRKPTRKKDDEDEEDEKPRKKARAGRDEGEDEDEERPRKKKKQKGGGSSLPLILGIGGGVLGLLLVVGLVWWFVGGPSKPGAGAGNKDGGTKDGPPPVKKFGKPDFTLKAADYAKEWHSNKAAAAAKYNGKVVELSGEVWGTGLWGGNWSPFLMFTAPEGVPPAHCYLADKQDWLKVGVGSKVTMIGRVANNPESGELILSPSEFKEIGPNPAITITSEDLAAEYAADPAAIMRKYKGKTLYITGKIVKKSDEGSGTTLELPAGKGGKSICRIGGEVAVVAAPLREGQSITIVDEISETDIVGPGGARKELRLNGMRIVVK